MITVSVNMTRLNKALSAMLKKVPADVQDPAVRKIAFDVVNDVQIGVATGGHGNPRRFDTGRYVAGWRVAGAMLGLGSLGPTSAARAGDGSMSTGRKGHALTVTLKNLVEYAQAVEYGTAKMAPGNHVTTALARAGKDVEEVVQQLMADAWSLG